MSEVTIIDRAAGDEREITIGQAYANAADQQARTEAVKAAQGARQLVDDPKPTMGERIAAFFRRWYVGQLQTQLAAERKLIAYMPAAVDAQKAEAQREYGIQLKEIDQLAAYHTAQARLEVHRITAKLARLGVKA